MTYVLAGGVGVLLAIGVIYVITYRPVNEELGSVSEGWIKDQIQGRRE